jgi:transposase-like protein
MDTEKSLPAGKVCPRCGSPDYLFRSRKKLLADADGVEPGGWETKYRCKACAKEWKVKTPA